MKQRFVVSALLFCIALTLVVSVGIAQNQRTGTSAAPELLIPVGARDQAMGGSTVAYTEGIEALYWNPSGLARMSNSAQGLFSSMSYIADIKVNYGAVAAHFGDFGMLGFSIKSLDFGKIPLTTVDDPENLSGATFSPTFVTLGVSYARPVSEAAVVGMTVKLINETIERVSASGVAFDIGIQYKGLLGLNGLSLGLAVKNIGPQMKFDGSGLLRSATSSEGIRPEQKYSSVAAGFELPSLLEIGAAYSGAVKDNMSYTLSTSYASNNLYLDEYHVGGEYAFKFSTLQLAGRAGYTFVPQIANSSDQIFGASFGFGLTYFGGGVDLTLDYAYRATKYFDNGNTFALRLGF